MSPPPGFISFCVRNPDQCGPPPGEPSAVALTDEHWRTIQNVNRWTNASISPQDDEAHYGRPEYWNIPSDGYGDCDDYALTKRKELIDRGFPETSLRIAIVDTPRDTRHAVLLVATDKGDLVLDNLSNEVKNRGQSDYTWLEEQDARNPRAWVSLQPDQARKAAAGAVK